MRLIAIKVFLISLLLVAVARADTPEAAWKAMKERIVHLDLRDGTEVEGQLIGVDGAEAVVLRPDGILATVKKADVAEIRGIAQATVPTTAGATIPAGGSGGGLQRSSPAANPVAPTAAKGGSANSNSEGSSAASVEARAAPETSQRTKEGERRRREAAQLRKTGQILGMAGIGPALAGLMFPIGLGITLGAATDSDQDPTTFQAREAGRALLGLGIPLYASGMTMIIVGGQLKKRAERIDSGAGAMLGSPALVPVATVGPAQVNFGVVGWF